ncbi:MAG: phage terminase large subunit [Patescibacteria group bacterium]|nr:phage terminase large subunit [Patescibacteria group bacterium]
MSALPDITKLKPEQVARLLDSANKELAERHLYEFVKQAWAAIDPSEFVDSWAIEALCYHLEAVTYGEIRYLLANFPPRCAKTLVTSVCWPVWCWLQKEKSVTSGSGVRFLCASYGAELSLKNSNKMRELLDSPWFQKHWGDKIRLRADQNTKSDFANTLGGNRQSTSITGRLIGFGGDIIICDDPHNTEDVESEAERENVLRGWREISTTRLNDPKRSAIVVIMQRLHEEDVSGQIIGSNDYENWCHLMIPMQFDSSRKCVTYIQTEDGEKEFWEDPREYDDELMWPERFGEREIEKIAAGLGPYMASGRLQQSPTPAGGGIIKREWWEPYEVTNKDGKYTFPPCEFVLASLDPAYTEKEENNYSALTVWGVWIDKNGLRKIILLDGWQKKLPIIAPRLDGSQIAGWSSMSDGERRAIERKGWGLTEWVADACQRFKVDRLLIEAKASGISVSQALRALYRDEVFGVQLIDPKRKDKVARMHAVVPMFTDGLVYRPPEEFPWVDMVVTQVSTFPKGANDDIPDSVSQALQFFRDNGLIQLKQERDIDEMEIRQYRPKSRPLYPGAR